MNWKTSAGGITMLISGVGMVLDAYMDGNPSTMPNWVVAAGAIGGGISLLFAADASKLQKLTDKVDDQSAPPFHPEEKK